jgi:restriction system protein
MGRQRDEPNLINELFELLLVVPFWAGPIVAFAFFAGLRWLLPWAFSGELDPDDLVGKTAWPIISQVSALSAPWVGALVLLLWIGAELRKRIDRHRLDRQTGIDSIRGLDWREFELLLSEVFRRRGYLVEHSGDAGPDGGIDQRLQKDGEITLVQCKHWRRQKVGVKIVRELRGVMASESAVAGVVVTSGGFTPDAVQFARDNRIKLIDGGELERVVREVRANAPQRSPTPPPTRRIDPSCPKCGSSMTKRIARRGSNPGATFWGCTRYPKCRGTKPIFGE